jgi:hypothetical protein
MRFAIIGLLVGSVMLSTDADAACILKREMMRGQPGCFGFVGYSQGVRVGFYRAGGILAAAGGKCPANYPAATQVSANQINVDGRVRTLSDDCRSGGN